MFHVRVRGSGSGFRVLSSRFGTPNPELRTVNPNSEHEPGTRNMEPGTALLISKRLRRVNAHRSQCRPAHATIANASCTSRRERHRVARLHAEQKRRFDCANVKAKTSPMTTPHRSPAPHPNTSPSVAGAGAERDAHTEPERCCAGAPAPNTPIASTNARMARCR